MRLLALVSCNEDYEGPWMLARGSESGAYVTNLHDDDEAGLEVELAGEDIHHSFGLKPGLNILYDAAGWMRYRAWKKGNKSSTTVEVYLGPEKEVR